MLLEGLKNVFSQCRQAPLPLQEHSLTISTPLFGRKVFVNVLGALDRIDGAFMEARHEYNVTGSFPEHPGLEELLKVRLSYRLGVL